MSNKQFLLDSFYCELHHTAWLAEKDRVFADAYFELLAQVESCTELSDDELEVFIDKFGALETLYDERIKDASTWIAPKKRAANELTHDEAGRLTQESFELLKAAIADKTGEKALISDTGKNISFDEKWYQMINSCSFKALAVEKIADFISKFIEPDGWAKYFVGNIGRNLKRQIQDYHVMDKYNLKHGTSYAALHLGGDTTKCVLMTISTGTEDGRGEPSGMTFVEIGAHTIIDRFIVGSFKRSAITEAGPEELAELFEIN